jgi:hypothetical protein
LVLNRGQRLGHRVQAAGHAVQVSALALNLGLQAAELLGVDHLALHVRDSLSQVVHAALRGVAVNKAMEAGCVAHGTTS